MYNYRKGLVLIIGLLFVISLSGCARFFKDFGEGVGLLVKYYIVPPITEAINILVIVYSYEKELQTGQPRANIQNIVVSFNQNRIEELLEPRNVKSDGNEGDKKKEHEIFAYDDIKFSLRPLDEKFWVQQRMEIIGKFELRIDDTKKIVKKIVTIRYFNGKDENTPLAKVSFDVYLSDEKQKENVIYFNKVNEKWFKIREKK